MAEVLPARLFATRVLGTIDIRENSFRTLHELDGRRGALVGASRNIANSDFEYAEIELSPRGLRDLKVSCTSLAALSHEHHGRSDLLRSEIFRL